MTRFIVFTVFLLLFLLPAYSQKDCCTADSVFSFQDKPWYGNEDYLPTFKDSFFLATKQQYDIDLSEKMDEPLYVIPIVFWIYDDGITQIPAIPDETFISASIAETNAVFEDNDLPFRFFLKCIQMVNLDAVPIDLDWDGETLADFDIDELIVNASFPFKDPLAINVHVHGLQDDNLYNPIPSDAIFMQRQRFVTQAGRSTLRHEIGHYFGLSHTHSLTEMNPVLWFSEPVTRDWIFGLSCGLRHCSFTGDFLCDTPADPNMRGEVATIGGMPVYVGGLNDCFGELYNPDVFNVMAYGNRPFRNNFSESQRTIMLRNVSQRVLSGEGSQWLNISANTAFLPDDYEDDNDATTARLLSFDELQEHNFHTNTFQCGDDMNDWFIIDYRSVSEDRIVTLSGIKTQANPIDAAGIRVVQTDINGNNPIDQAFQFNQDGNVMTLIIPCEYNASNSQLRLLVPKDENIATRDYTIELEDGGVFLKINANKQACVGDILSIDDLPADAVVLWSSGGNITLSNAQGSTSSITNAQGEGMWVEAEIVTGNGCVLTLRHEYTVATVTLQQLGGIQYFISGDECAPRFEFKVAAEAGAGNYQWSCNGHSNFVGCSANGNSAFGYINGMNPFETVQINVSVTVSNDCGDVVTRSVGVTYTAGDCEWEVTGDDPRSLDISPNPSDTDFTVTITEADPAAIISSYTIMMTDPYGQTSTLMDTPNKVFSINSQNMMNGIHYLHVLVGEELVSEQVIIQH